MTSLSGFVNKSESTGLHGKKRQKKDFRADLGQNDPEVRASSFGTVVAVPKIEGPASWTSLNAGIDASKDTVRDLFCSMMAQRLPPPLNTARSQSASSAH
jgi:hypothetical protein